MSSDIYAKPHVSRKASYNTQMEQEGSGWREMDVEIYNCSDHISDDPTGFHLQEEGPQARTPVHRKWFREAALCLGVLCLLLMTVIIILSANYVSVTTEKVLLQTRLNNLSYIFNQSQTYVKELEGKLCPKQWKKVGCSCYFKSTQNKTWSDSRRDCEGRGSDLVVINSKEEQDFVTGLIEHESWIGLRTTENSSSHLRYKWEWVDGSAPTKTFWPDGLSHAPVDWLYVSCCDQQGKWTNHTKSEKRNWICEK